MVLDAIVPVFSGDLGFNAFGHAREFAERTIADFTRAAEVNPTYPIPISNRALLYEQTKQYDLAFADYDKLISLRPDDTYYRERKAALLDKFAPEPEPIILKSRSPSAPVTAPLEVEGEPLQPAPSPAPVPIAAIIAHSTRCETIHQWDVRASSV